MAAPLLDDDLGLPERVEDLAVEQLVAEARRILEAMERAQREGSGAVTLDGKLIDIASVRQAAVIVRQAELIGLEG